MQEGKYTNHSLNGMTRGRRRPSVAVAGVHLLPNHRHYHNATPTLSAFLHSSTWNSLTSTIFILSLLLLAMASTSMCTQSAHPNTTSPSPSRPSPHDNNRGSNNDSSLPAFDNPLDENDSLAGVAVDRIKVAALPPMAVEVEVTSQHKQNHLRRRRRRTNHPHLHLHLHRRHKDLSKDEQVEVEGDVTAPPQPPPPPATAKSPSMCENGGVYANGKCQCFYPFVGTRCVDYACEHGLSVGARYDPESTFFNLKCICDEDWVGDYCNVPIADQCNERGQYINGRCKCHGYYFGPRCQYVGKCLNGKLQEGLCRCEYGYEGDYCDQIHCHHGYRDKLNNSESCICPPRHTGQFCDECRLSSNSSFNVLPYPNCTLEPIPNKARLSRQKTNYQILSRLVIMICALALLLLLLLTMLLMHWSRSRATPALGSEAKQRAAEERTLILQKAIFPQHNSSSSKLAAAATAIGGNNNAAGSIINSTRRNSRFSDPNRLDHDLL